VDGIYSDPPTFYILVQNDIRRLRHYKFDIYVRGMVQNGVFSIGKF